MGAPKLVTTTEAALILSITVKTFRERAKKAGVEPQSTRKGEGRGRPAFLWSAAQVRGLR